MTTDSLRTIQLRLPRCRSTMILPVDFATSQIKDVVGNALLGEQRDSDCKSIITIFILIISWFEIYIYIYTS